MRLLGISLFAAAALAQPVPKRSTAPAPAIVTILAPEPTTWAQKLKSSDWWLGEAGAGYAALL